MLREIDERFEQELADIKRRILYNTKMGLCAGMCGCTWCLTLCAYWSFKAQWGSVILNAVLFVMHCFIVRVNWNRLK